MLRILAFLIFSQPAGVLADRIDRKRILVAADLLRFGLVALFPFVTSVWQIYAMVFVVNAITAFFTPTFEATLPSVVGNDGYVKALAWSRVATDVEAVGAPALAAILVASSGVRWLFWFDAATYLASAALVVSASFPGVAANPQPFSARAFLSDLTHGTRILFREPSLRQALLMSIAEATAGSCAIVLTVGYARDVLERGETAAALLMATVGVGSTAAALVLGRATGRYEMGTRDPAVLHGRRHRWSRAGLIGGGALLSVSLLPGALQPALVAFAVLWLLNGTGQALIAIPSSTLLAEHAGETERGRAYAAHFAWTHAFWLASYPAIGHAAARWGVPRTLTGAGCACAVVVLVATLVGRGAATNHLHGRDQGAESTPLR